MAKIETLHVEYFDGELTPEQEMENVQTVASVLNILAVDVLNKHHPLRTTLENMASEFKASTE